MLAANVVAVVCVDVQVFILSFISKYIIAVFKCCADVGRGSDKGKNVLPFWIICES